MIDNNNDKNNLNLNSNNIKKINILSFNLDEKEIQSLLNLKYFEYKGDLKEKFINYDIIYNEVEYILLELNKSKYNWEIYKYIFDKKIIIEFTAFLLEFIINFKFKDN